jgi:hypothetical protein
MGKCQMKERQRKSGKSNIMIIHKKIFCGNVIIVTVLIISSINIFDISDLDEVILFMHS